MLYFNAPSTLTLNNTNLFTYQYFFENDTICILEIRRNDLIIDDFSKAYQWLVYNKKTSKISPLHMRFADSSAAVEERFFEEGYLKFTLSNATFIEKYNSALHNLKQLKDVVFPSSIHQAVADFIK
jgi:hypothetical protein